ncbi:hypothetical protein QUF80_23780 [Desulfococcaceae bacterium HSG8]|nr:hypothetical protein [Desulfococcaceae bacterium HSG8]
MKRIKHSASVEPAKASRFTHHVSRFTFHASRFNFQIKKNVIKWNVKKPNRFYPNISETAWILGKPDDLRSTSRNARHARKNLYR